MKTAQYLSGYSLDGYLDNLCVDHPELYSVLSRERCRDASGYVADMNSMSWEFEGEQVGGRGLSYNVAQKNFDNRRIGMIELLSRFSSGRDLPEPDFRILDVLGGDGTLARFCRRLGPSALTIYTADISRFMIDACYAQALPCVRQSATKSLFRDSVLDGVLIAYGSHHLDGSARQQAVREAYRTLKSGGRLVLHDFEIGGACANWFDHVVHPYSRTGHDHRHFSREEMDGLLTSAGFRDIEVSDMPDHFVLRGRSADEARHNAIMHMYHMYDLVNIADATDDVAARLEPHIAATLGPLVIRREGDGYVAEISRRALVAVGRKQEAG